MTEHPMCDSGVSHEESACSVMEALNRVSGKWSIGILLAAMSGPVRFTELERSVKGISRRMLTLTLRNLERDGLLVRTVYPTVPPKVEYTVTDMARELHDALSALTEWAQRNRAGITAAQGRYDTAGDGAPTSGKSGAARQLVIAR